MNAMNAKRDADELQADVASSEEFIALTRARADEYALLSRAFRKEMDESALDTLHGMLYPVSSGNEDIDTGNRMLAHYLSNLWSGSLEQLAVDYFRTFVGEGNDGYSAAYPFESVYTSEKRLLMQESRDEVVAIYRSEGLDKSKEWPDSEDHIALELEFMQTMATRAADALEDGNEDEAYRLYEVQRNFLEGHLCPWEAMMTADIRNVADTEFYQALAYITDGFLETEHEILAKIVTAPGSEQEREQEQDESQQARATAEAAKE